MNGLHAIQERLLGPDVKLDGVAPKPIVVLVSSLGGGAGSGIFIDVADAFHLPLVFLADNPGVLPGRRSEQAGILRKGGSVFRHG